MQIQLNIDHHIQGSEARQASTITQHLRRPYLTRIEMHLADANDGKGGGHDRQRALEAPIGSRSPVGISHDDETME